MPSGSQAKMKRGTAWWLSAFCAAVFCVFLSAVACAQESMSFRPATADRPARMMRKVLEFSLGAFSVSNSCDCASADSFAPGTARDSAFSEDHLWRMKLYLRLPRVIKSISIVAEDGSKAWSTQRDPINGVAPDPLVVFFNGRKINDAYNQLIGDLGTGDMTIDLFGQTDGTPLTGGELTIAFFDGGQKSAGIVKIPLNDEVACPAECR